MKKSLLLLASMLVSAVSFAQWTAPVPSTTEDMKAEQYQYLYNVEAGGFFAGANDWNTRASIASFADSVYFSKAESGNGYNFNCRPSVKTGWLYVSCNGWDAMWVDAGNATANTNYPGTDTWQIEKVGNYYQISNSSTDVDYASAPFAVVENVRGVADTRVYLYDANIKYTYTEDEEEVEAPVFSGNVYKNWVFIGEEEYQALKPKVEAYRAAMDLAAAIAAAKAENPSYDWSVVEAVYNNTSSTTEALKAASAKCSAVNSFKKAYEAAMETYSKLDFSAPKAVYDNTASTAEELAAAESDIQAIINDFMTSQASFESPVDFTDVIGDGSSVDPWTRDFTGEGTTGSHSTNTWSTEANGGADGTDMTTPFIEHWTGSGGILSDQKIYQVFKGAAPGLYKFTANVRAYSEAGGIDSFEGLTMYFGNESVDLQSQTEMTKAGSKCVLWSKNYFNIIAIVKESGDIEFGFNIKDANFNWLAFKGTSLKYYGNENVEENALKLVRQAYNVSAYEGTDANPDVIAAYNDKVAAFEKAVTTEEMDAAAKEVEEAKAALEANIEAYKAYFEKVEEVKAFMNDHSLSSESADILADYTMDDNPEEPAEGEYNGNGTYDYIKGYTLDTEAITAETAWVTETFKQAFTELFKPGFECTEIIINPNFADPNGKGWIKATGAGMNSNLALTGGIIPGQPVAESWHSYFDIYQEITGIPDGVYQLSLNGFCRLDDGVDSDVAAELYMNEFVSPLQDIVEGALPKEEAVDGINCYLSNGDQSAAIMSNPIFAGNSHKSPNDATDSQTSEGAYYPNGMEGASVAFSADRYKAIAQGYVSGGKLTIGVRNTTSLHQWALWGNFRLTYLGTGADAVYQMMQPAYNALADYIAKHEDVLTAPAMADAQAVIENADAAKKNYDEAEMTAAIVDLGAGLTAAKANVAAVNELTAASDELDETVETYTKPSAAAKEAFAAVDAKRNNYSGLTTEEVEALVQEIKDVIEALKVPVTDDASDDDPVNMTGLIVNADFESNAAGQQATGWTLEKGEGATGNYQVQNGFNSGKVSMEFWSPTNGSGTKFNFYQDIADLPAGTYELTANAANSYNDQAAGPGEGAAYLYVAVGQGDNYVYTDNGAIEAQTAPCNGDAQAYSEYSIIFTVAEGDIVRIGAKNVGELSARWVMIDDFKLTYYGKNSAKTPSEGNATQTAISNVAANTVAPAGIYTISGAKVANLQKGINIVKMADGSVKKVLVK